jgi:hypothetical protein
VKKCVCSYLFFDKAPGFPGKISIGAKYMIISIGAKSYYYGRKSTCWREIHELAAENI